MANTAPCERPVPVRYGGNHSMDLNNTTIKEATVQITSIYLW
jgi:hypothetical protein